MESSRPDADKTFGLKKPEHDNDKHRAIVTLFGEIRSFAVTSDSES